MNELVFKSSKGNPVTNSKVVAERFNKNHKDVLKAIRNLECSDDFHKRNFAPMFFTSQIGNGGKRQDPYTVMTRDGFTFLAMGFTGKEAGKFKEQFIEAFNLMESKLRNSVPVIPGSFAEALELAAHQAREIERKNEIIAIQSPKVQLADRLIDTETRIDVGQAAKLLKLSFGRNTFFKELRDRGIFFKNRNEPKQEYIDRGYFQLFMVIIPTNHGDLSKSKIVVTQKGLLWLSKQFNVEYDSKFPNLNTAI